jgi:hypothetical protein
MYAFFKFVLYLGVAMGIAGLIYPSVSDHPALAGLPAMTKDILSFGGLGLIVLGLLGRSATKPEPKY